MASAHDQLSLQGRVFIAKSDGGDDDHKDRQRQGAHEQVAINVQAPKIYVMLDMDTKKCVTMKALPENMKKYRMLGKYPTLGEAEATMHTMTECK